MHHHRSPSVSGCVALENFRINECMINIEIRGGMEKEMATHSSILAWKIPWTEELAGSSPRGCKGLDTIEWLNTKRWKEEEGWPRIIGGTDTVFNVEVRCEVWRKALVFSLSSRFIISQVWVWVGCLQCLQIIHSFIYKFIYLRWKKHHGQIMKIEWPERCPVML